ncbi:hypothetical protein CFP56_024930 [Quercus suber]|uniref:Uncharacterized protein n=1 Tax=Quercus suber TaxID=58331 RepID=A0AAW0LXD9_QUESU
MKDSSTGGCWAEYLVHLLKPEASVSLCRCLSNHDLPFNDTLDWTKFSVIATEKGLPLQDTVKDKKGKNFSKLHNNLLQTHNPSQSQNPSESPNSTSFFCILIIAIIRVLPTCLSVCFHIYASQEVRTHIYFNIHNPQDSGFIYDYDDLIYPVPF